MSEPSHGLRESARETLADTTQLGGTPNTPGDPSGAAGYGRPDSAESGVDGPVRRPVPATGVDPVEANVLYADRITIRFGGLTAVDNVTFSIPPKSVVSLIGPNGAGKTTFFNVLTGLYEATEGAVYLDGKDITPVKPHKRAAMGLARTFQNIRLFGLMTAEENVMVAMHSHLKANVMSTIIRTPGQRREEREARESARELLDYVGIGKTVGELARNLSYGDQRRLEIARAMALKPKVLLLDEPTAGMNPQESANFNDFVYRVRDEKGISVLLIEHDMSVIMKISERITVLDRGAMIAEGTPDDIRNNQQVIEAYLGKTGTREGKRQAAAPTDATQTSGAQTNGTQTNGAATATTNGDQA
jgi:branched-chain amino acid transport system ATP-binding protein